MAREFVKDQLARLRATKAAIVQNLPNDRFRVTSGTKSVEIGLKDEQIFYQFLSELNI
jgi:hypothetical protein